MALERLAMLLELRGTDGVVRGLQNVERQAGRSLGRTERNLDDIGRNMQRVGAAATGMGLLMGAGLFSAAESAGQLQDSIRNTERVFGDAADVIADFAATSAEAVGLSEAEFRASAARLGSFLQNYGFEADAAAEKTVELTTRAADMAAAFGTDTAQAIDAIAAALRGERDPIEQFGVSIKQVDINARLAAQGLADTEGEARKAAEAAAAIDLIFEQTGTTVGAFGESSMAAAQTARAEFENAKAALGEAFLPVLQDVAEGASDLLGWFNDLDPATKSLVSRIATLSAAVLVVGGGLTTVVGTLIRMRETMTAATAAARAHAGAVGAVSTALAVATAAYIAHNASQADDADRIAELTAAIGQYQDGVAGTVDWLNREIQVHEDLGELLNDNGVDFREFAEALNGTDEDFRSYTDSAIAAAIESGATGSEIQALELVFRELRGEVGEANESLQDSIAFMDGGTGSGEHFARSVGNAADAAGDAEDDIDDLGDTADDAADKVDDLDREFRELIGAFVAEPQARAEAQAWLAGMRDRIAEVQEKGDEVDLADLRTELFDSAFEAAGLAGDLTEAGTNIGQIDRFTDDAEASLLAFAEVLGIPRSEVQGIIDGLDQLDGRVVEARVNITTRGAVGIGGVIPRAAGGPVVQDQAYVVGERGPELFVPGRSGTIVPNHQMTGPLIGEMHLHNGSPSEIEAAVLWAHRTSPL